MSQYKDKFLALWPQLQIGQSFWMVDYLTNEEFWIVDIDHVTLETRPQPNIKITKQAFIEVIDYLVENSHYQDKPCEAKSDDSYEQSVPLSKLVQEANPYMEQCALNYVLAILKGLGFVEISSNTRLKQVWLVELAEEV